MIQNHFSDYLLNINSFRLFNREVLPLCKQNLNDKIKRQK